MHGIGWAVKQMLEGHHVARAGWNGRGMWICITFQRRDPSRTTKAIPWTCSQADLLATDWVGA